MRRLMLVGAAFASIAVLVACGGSADTDLFGDSGADGTAAGDAPSDGAGDAPSDGEGDTSLVDVVDTGPPCTNLECQIPKCDSGTTTLSGVVYDPAGLRPVPNVAVYVPNGAPAALVDGATCASCQAPLSGKPLSVVTTDAKGQFSLKDVPAGANIPLVLQLGKWRRQLAVPSVTACQDNAQPDKTLRLPKNHNEGDIPLIAFTTGCDQAECFLVNTVGLDPSELTGPAGGGRVHIYKAHDSNQGLPANPGAATSLWGSLVTMQKYDLVLDACECSTYDRGTPQGYANMKAYLDAGGRMLGTHYFYNFFASTAQCGSDATCQGPSDFSGVAQWLQSQYLPAPYLINTSVPKGTTMADWYKAIKPSSTYGQIPLVDIRNDVHQVTAGKATPWLYAGALNTSYDAYYLSFNTPVSQPVANQCGRAVFSDVHLVDAMKNQGQAWPASCGGGYATVDHSDNELALEYLFFDMSSCVQDDTKPAVVPPTQ